MQPRGLSNQPPLFWSSVVPRRSTQSRSRQVWRGQLPTTDDRRLTTDDRIRMALLTGKRAAIFGVANDHSIAWAIAQRLHAEGAELALTYPNESIEKRVRPLAESIGVDLVLPCGVTDDAQIEAVFSVLAERWSDGLDAVVHSLAFAGREDLK